MKPTSHRNLHTILQTLWLREFTDTVGPLLAVAGILGGGSQVIVVQSELLKQGFFPPVSEQQAG